MEAKKDPILRYIAAVCFIGLALLNLSKFLTYTLQQIAFLHKTLLILVIYALFSLAWGLITSNKMRIILGSGLTAVFYMFDFLFIGLYLLNGSDDYSVFNLISSVTSVISYFIILSFSEDPKKEYSAHKTRVLGIVCAAVNLILFIIWCVSTKSICVIDLLSTVFFCIGAVLLAMEISKEKSK